MNNKEVQKSDHYKLEDLIIERDFTAADKMLEEGLADINGRFHFDRTILIRLLDDHVYLPQHQIEAAVDYVLSKSPDLDVQDGDRNTALHLACKYRSPKIVHTLLQKGANTLIKNRRGRTPCTCGEPLSFMPVNFNMEKRFVGIITRCLVDLSKSSNPMTEFLTEGVYDPRLLITIASFAYDAKNRCSPANLFWETRPLVRYFGPDPYEVIWTEHFCYLNTK